MRALHISGAIIAAATAASLAQGPTDTGSQPTVVFENAQLRIMNVSIPPGAMSEHRHDYDIVTISMNGGADTRAQAAGQSGWTARPPRAAGHAQITDYTGMASVHRVENVGRTSYQLFALENLRSSGWTTSAGVAALATTRAAESRAFRAYDVRLTREVSQTSHAHAVPTIVVLIAGKALSDGSDAKAKLHAPAPVGLKQLDGPGQWLLVPEGESHHVVRLGTADAYLVEVEVR